MASCAVARKRALSASESTPGLQLQQVEVERAALCRLRHADAGSMHVNVNASALMAAGRIAAAQRAAQQCNSAEDTAAHGTAQQLQQQRQRCVE